MPNKYVQPVKLYHVQIGRGSFRNFSGTKTKFNKTGKRIISIFLPEDRAEEMKADGWYIKYYTPSSDMEDEAAEPIPFIDCEELDEEDLTALKLDRADIIDVDVRLSPYTWINDDGERKIKAYVDKLRIRMEDDF